MGRTKELDELGGEELMLELAEIQGLSKRKPHDVARYAELQREVHARAARRAVGCCDYCGRACGSEPYCKETERHDPAE